MGCLKANGMKDCAGYLSALNECLDKKKAELAPKYGLNSIKWRNYFVNEEQSKELFDSWYL